MFKKPAAQGHAHNRVKLRRTGLYHANRLAAVSLNATPSKAAKNAKVELSTARHKKVPDLSGAFGRMLRCARSMAGSARPPPSRASPAAKFARSNGLLRRLPLRYPSSFTSSYLPFQANSGTLL